ncbi:MAG: HAD family phosphatase [Bacilli bacterium]|nr:HAD family phosphatase [Bacilli bacterium]
MLKINKREIKGFIFDLDGTLLDSLGVWKQIDRRFFAKRNMELPEGYAVAIAHLGLEGAAEYTIKTYNINENPDDIIREWTEESIHMYHEEVLLKDNALDLLIYLKSKDIKLTIATAGNEELFVPCLIRNGVREYFEGYSTVQNAGCNKNSPDIYLHAVKRLGLKPSEVAVIEDMSVGASCAKEAGCFVIGLADIHHLEENNNLKNVSDIYAENYIDLLNILTR